jgi:hypothetical protein
MINTETTTESKTTACSKLDPKDLLIAEFEYIAGYASQANEDRARVSSYYFVTAAAAVAAILGTNLQNGSVWIYLGLMLLFAVLSFIGYCTVLQLARLRVAWRDSADAMNRVVECYLDKLTDSQVEKALVWFKRKEKLPAEGRVESMAFLLALSVIGADSVTTIVAFIYAGQGVIAFVGHHWDPFLWWVNIPLAIVAIIPGYFYARFQIHEYFECVRRQPTDAKTSFLEQTLRRLRLLQATDSPSN